MPEVDTVSVEILPALCSAPLGRAATAEILTADGAVAFYGSAVVGGRMGVFMLWVWCLGGS